MQNALDRCGGDALALPVEPGSRAAVQREVIQTPSRAIALLSTAAFASAANLRICDPLLPQIASQFSVTVGTAAWIVTVFSMSYGLLQLVHGPLGDAFGKFRVAGIGSLVTGIATASCALMPNLDLLALARAIAGGAAAAVIPLAIAWIGDVIPYERRQPVIAKFLSGQILGVVFGQAAGGVMGDLFGWRNTMVVLGVVHLIAGSLLMLEVRRRPDVDPSSLRTGTRPRWRDVPTSALAVLSEPWPRVVLATTFLEAVFMFGALSYVGAELHRRFGLGPGASGLMLAAFGGGAITYALTATRFVRRFGEAGLARWGSLLMSLGYVVLALTPTLVLVPFAVATIGLGLYMFHNTLQTNATQMSTSARGLAVSLFALFFFIGQSFGVSLAAPVIDAFGGLPVFIASAIALPLAAHWFRYRLAGRPPRA